MYSFIRLVTFVFTTLILSACSSGVSSNESFVCKTVFEPWNSIDLFESKNYRYLYSSTGVSQLGDNSESSRLLELNSIMASAIRERLTENDDEQLQNLATSHYFYQRDASNYGKDLMRNLIYLAKEDMEFRDFEFNLMKKSFVKQMSAGNTRTQMRSRCIELGFSG
jgi:hypothetical protein